MNEIEFASSGWEISTNFTLAGFSGNFADLEISDLKPNQKDPVDAQVWQEYKGSEYSEQLAVNN